MIANVFGIKPCLSFLFNRWARNDIPKPYYLEQDYVFVDGLDLMHPCEPKFLRSGKGQWLPTIGFEPEVEFKKPGRRDEKKEGCLAFSQEDQERHKEQLYNALLIINQSPTGRYLLQTAKEKGIHFFLFREPEGQSGAAGYWDRDCNRIGVNVSPSLFSVAALAKLLVHELAHAEQTYKRRAKSCITPSVSMKYVNAIEADARVHELMVALELKKGCNGFQTDRFMSAMLSWQPSLSDLMLTKLENDNDLTLENLEEKACQARFDAYYTDRYLRSCYENWGLAGNESRLAKIVNLMITFASPYTFTSLFTRLVNTGLRHRFQAVSHPDYLAKNMTVRGKPYLADFQDIDKYKEPLYTSISKSGKAYLRQAAYFRFLDTVFMPDFDMDDEIREIEIDAKGINSFSLNDRMQALLEKTGYVRPKHTEPTEIKCWRKIGYEHIQTLESARNLHAYP